MSRYFNIRINEGDSEGPYTIYYDQVNPSNIAAIYGNGLPATGLTLTQLTTGNGVAVYVPNDTNTIIVYNELLGCDFGIEIIINTTPTPTPTITSTPTLTSTPTPTLEEFRYEFITYFGATYQESCPSITEVTVYGTNSNWTSNTQFYNSLTGPVTIDMQGYYNYNNESLGLNSTGLVVDGILLCPTNTPTPTTTIESTPTPTPTTSSETTPTPTPTTTAESTPTPTPTLTSTESSPLLLTIINNTTNRIVTNVSINGQTQTLTSGVYPIYAGQQGGSLTHPSFDGIPPNMMTILMGGSGNFDFVIKQNGTTALSTMGVGGSFIVGPYTFSSSDEIVIILTDSA